MLKINPTKRFYKDMLHLPKSIQAKVWKSIGILQSNPYYPSLRTKKMEVRQNIWEGRITKSYRFTFEIKGDICILRRVGTHDILENEG